RSGGRIEATWPANACSRMHSVPWIVRRGDRRRPRVRLLCNFSADWGWLDRRMPRGGAGLRPRRDDDQVGEDQTLEVEPTEQASGQEHRPPAGEDVEDVHSHI